MTNHFFEKEKSLMFSEIIKKLNIQVADFSDILIDDVTSLEDAKEGCISFFHNPKYLEQLKNTKASAVLIEEKYVKHLPLKCIPIITDQPYRIFGMILSLFYPKQKSTGVHSPSASISASAEIGENVTIESFVVVKAGSKIGDNAILKSHTVIGENVQIGKNAYIEEHVTIKHAIIGDGVFIKSGARIGQAGFGFYMDKKGHFDVPQIGCVRIGNNVQIGSNTTIDRGSQYDTVIHNGVRIDNLVQIAHNVVVGENSVLVAQVGVAGSTKLGKFVIAAGQAGFAGHLNVGNFVKIAGQSGVMRDIKDGETVAGTPAQNATDWHRQTIALKKIIKQ